MREQVYAMSNPSFCESSFGALAPVSAWRVQIGYYK